MSHGRISAVDRSSAALLGVLLRVPTDPLAHPLPVLVPRTFRAIAAVVIVFLAIPGISWGLTLVGILVVDFEGRITTFNHRFMEMWKIPRDIMQMRDDDRAIAFVLDQLK